MPQSDPPSIFGLSEAQLRPIVAAAVGEAVESFEIGVEHEIAEGYYGFAAEKLIPTFAYVTPEGRRGQVTVFAKHSHNPESPESEHYRFLDLHGVPLPRVYGVLRSSEDRPVLFLEHLDMRELTAGALPPEVRLEFLSLMARFNAVRPSPDYAAWLGALLQREREEELGLGETVEMVWEHACRGEVGEELKRVCSEDPGRRVRLCALADRVTSQVAEMQIGLVSGDFSFENTGRRLSGERVMFDVEGIGLGPRFTDAAGLINRPEELWPPAPYPLREELAEHYLREYARWGGTLPVWAQFLSETRILWLRYQIGIMSWTVGRAREESPSPAGESEAFRRGLLRNMTMLLEGHC